MDGQLHATHVILGYKSISSSFQSPKNVIKAKDPRLKQINIAVPGFLTGPPLEGTHQAVLLVQPIAEEGATSSGSAREEEMVKIIKVTDSEEEFEVFDQLDLTESPSTTSRFLPSAQISADQETANIPKAMVLQRRKDTNLLKLLESHVGGSTPEVAIQPRPPTSLPTHTFPSEQPEKKRKRDRKGKEITEEGEVVPSKDYQENKTEAFLCSSWS